MTKFEAGVRYEIRKLLKHIGLFIAGVAIFLGAIQLTFFPFTGVAGFGSVGSNGAGSFAFLFLIFWTAIAFGSDAGFFLQSGLTRREVFVIFVLAVATEAFVFAFLDVVLSLTLSGIRSGQPFSLSASLYAVTVLIQAFLLNLAVAFCSLAVTVLKRRIGAGWTTVLVLGIFLLATVGLPALLSLFIGGTEAYGRFVAALMGSPYASELHTVFYLVVALASSALTWLLLRRVNADRFAAGR